MSKSFNGSLASKMEMPRLKLAVDNCFAYKRWTQPEEWMDLARSAGLQYVEASADTEADPMYMGESYMKAWTDRVLLAQEKSGVTVANLYSGHGTYTLLGLANPEDAMRRRFIDEWLKPMMNAAGRLGCGMGFFCHGFPDWILQDPQEYEKRLEILYDDLAETAQYARQVGLSAVSLEQMYSPHMVPWTLDGCKTLLKEVYRRGGCPMYLTLDTGHMSMQRLFRKPDEQTLYEWAGRVHNGQYVKEMYLGLRAVREQFLRNAETGITAGQIRETLNKMDQTPYLFSLPEDAEIDEWIRALATYSPILHLQQTDGKSSSHKHFSPEENAGGIVSTNRVLEEIRLSYIQEEGKGMPPRVNEIVLTLEPFTATASLNEDTLHDLALSVAYWREALPETEYV